MNCPRCGAPLCERPTGPRWLRFFECRQCCLVFEIVVERHLEPCGHNPKRKFMRHTFALQLGRTRNHRGVLSRRESVYRRLIEGDARNFAIRGDLSGWRLRRSRT
jgi:hypothetical protein